MYQHPELKKRPIEFKKFYIPMIVIYIPCFIYAFLRYTISHNEPLHDLPFYLTNKVLGVTSVIMISLCYVIGPASKVWSHLRAYLGHRKYLGIGGFTLGAAHGFMSLLLMNPSNYSVFYDSASGRLNWNGSLSMLFGTIALVHLTFITVISLPPVMRELSPRQWKQLQRGGLIAALTSFLHIASFGYVSWFDFAKWYNGMPPFSLIGASSIVLLYFLRRFLMKYLVYKKSNSRAVFFPYFLTRHKILRESQQN